MTAQFGESGRVVETRCHGRRDGTGGHLRSPVRVPIVVGRHESRHRQLGDRRGGKRLRHSVGGGTGIGRGETGNISGHRGLSDGRRSRGQDRWEGRNHGSHV